MTRTKYLAVDVDDYGLIFPYPEDKEDKMEIIKTSSTFVLYNGFDKTMAQRHISHLRKPEELVEKVMNSIFPNRKRTLQEKL